MSRSAVPGVGLVIAAVMLTGAYGEQTTSTKADRTATAAAPHADKNGTGERRTDLEPLLKRFEVLGQPQSASWYSGTLGDPEVPGPNSYWIDAVVTLGAGRAQELATTYAAEPSDTRPDPVGGLASDLPTGDLLGGPQLDRAFSTSFSTRVWIDTAGERIVLIAKGQ